MIAITDTTGDYESLLFDATTFVLIPVSILVSIQYYLLPMLVVAGLMLFIPLGIVFRAFPFVRGIGGTLIAIGIGLALVYPTILVVVNNPISNVVQNLSNPNGNPCGSGGFAWFLNLLTQAIGYVTSGSSAAGVGYATGLCSFTSIYPAVNLTTYYSILGITQYLLFIMDLAIGYPIVNGIAKSLGGAVTLSLGGKLKIA